MRLHKTTDMTAPQLLIKSLNSPLFLTAVLGGQLYRAHLPQTELESMTSALASEPMDDAAKAVLSGTLLRLENIETGDTRYEPLGAVKLQHLTWDEKDEPKVKKERAKKELTGTSFPDDSFEFYPVIQA